MVLTFNTLFTTSWVPKKPIHQAMIEFKTIVFNLFNVTDLYLNYLLFVV